MGAGVRHWACMSGRAGYDVVIVGGGIVGLAVARAVLDAAPSTRLLLVEKETDWARHQTGHNSGVIHSGLYYPTGTLKARFCLDGNRSMVEFCRRHDIAVDVCGKLVVATDSSELAALERLTERGRQHGLDVQPLDAGAIREREPHVSGIAGLWVRSTGIVDYVAVARCLADDVASAGGELRLGTTFRTSAMRSGRRIVVTDQGDFTAGLMVSCAGLHSDRVARSSGTDPQARIVPFRGEYYELVRHRRHLIKGLVYPVPNPAFPFLGVHFTRMIDGSVHAGPNAVLGLKREGYRKSDVSVADVADVLGYPGFWRLAVANSREGMAEIHRSLSKAAFVRSLQRLVPELGPSDIVPAGAGVRAQAIGHDGRLVDDFLIVDGPAALHVCNAPSPAATASLEIGRSVALRVLDRT
jgi:L-2-hydroxyglutarate oxidase